MTHYVVTWDDQITFETIRLLCTHILLLCMYSQVVWFMLIVYDCAIAAVHGVLELSTNMLLRSTTTRSWSVMVSLYEHSHVYFTHVLIVVYKEQQLNFNNFLIKKLLSLRIVSYIIMYSCNNKSLYHRVSFWGSTWKIL